MQNFITWMVQQYVKPDEAQQIFSKGGYCASPDAVKGLDLLGQLRDAGVFIDNVQGYTADQMTSAYFNGKAAMMPSGSWGYTEAPGRDRRGHHSWPASRPPRAACTPSRPRSRATPTASSSRPTGEKKIDAVEKFIKFMYEQPVLQGWVSEGSQIMSVRSDVIGEVTSTQPLVVKGNEVPPTVDFLLLPDSYIPAGTDYQPAGTEFLGKKGQPGAEFCKALDKLYTE